MRDEVSFGRAFAGAAVADSKSHSRLTLPGCFAEMHACLFVAALPQAGCEGAQI